MAIDEERELSALKLAACDSAAMSNTRSSYNALSIGRENRAWSPAYESVRQAVLREIEYREQLDAIRQIIHI